MSEKLFLFLLRLYPGHFRKAYGPDALQLVRDRARDERGFAGAIRLWFDLLSDFAVSLPRVYSMGEPAPVGMAPESRLQGIPSFQSLDDETVPASALFSGSVVAIVLLGGIVFFMSRAVNFHPSRQALMGANSPSPAGAPKMHSDGSAAAGDGDTAELGAGQSSGANAQPGAAPLRLVSAGSTMWTAVDRQQVLDGVKDNLQQHYFDPAAAQAANAALQAHLAHGDYDLMKPDAFAEAVTRQMREASHDMHLELVYSESVLPTPPSGPPPAGVPDAYRQALLRQNCMIEKVDVIGNRVGYLKLNAFPDVSVCGAAAGAAMAKLNGADAVIFDLRDNGGGFPEMTSYIASYLFDHPVLWFNPREANPERSMTQSPRPGNRLADKPVYVLTSAKTWSGAEQFSYDLRMMKRATIVGETTRGGAHVGAFHRINDHFGIGVPEQKVENPFGKPDWEGIGVAPDVPVKAADALDTALRLAREQIGKR